MSHSPIGASSMYRWMRCPGSVKLCEKMPSYTSTYAEEGTRAHALAAECLLGGTFLKAEVVGKEMAEAVNLYITEVEKALGSGEEVFVEKQFSLAHIHPNLFGTADAVVHQKKKRLLKVFDLKYGAGVSVEVEDNPQLLYYALGALQVVGREFVEKVEMTIVQPRCFHEDGPVRTWSISIHDIIEFSKELKKYASATEKPDAPLVSGEHCKFCRARATCPLLHQEANAVAQALFEDQTPAFSSEQLSKALTIIPKLEAFIKGVREFAYIEAVAGRTPSGFKLVEKRATRKWIDEASAESALRALGHDENSLYERSFKSPAQIEKIVGKKNVAPLVASVSTGTTLVAVQDKRPEVRLVATSDFPFFSDDT